jgi:hypothetical protein
VAPQPGIREMFCKDDVEQEVTGAIVDLKRHHQAACGLLFYALWHSHHVLETLSDGTIEDVLARAAASS